MEKLLIEGGPGQRLCKLSYMNLLPAKFQSSR